MKEEKLFEIVRDEQGYLIVQLTGTHLSSYLPFNIRQQMKHEWEKKTILEDEGDTTRREQVVKMLEEGIPIKFEYP